MKFEIISKKEQKKAIEKMNSAFMPDAYAENVMNYINDSKSSFHTPERSSGYSAGYDFILPMNVIIPVKTMVLIPTFIKIKLDEDKMLNIYPRSSYGIKKNLIIPNSVGIIDADYYNNKNNEGHIFVAYKNIGEEEVNLYQGDKFAQGIIQNFYLIENDEYGKGKERIGGIGSSGS